jgi:hypothetical protein
MTPSHARNHSDTSTAAGSGESAVGCCGCLGEAHDRRSIRVRPCHRRRRRLRTLRMRWPWRSCSGLRWSSRTCSPTGSCRASSRARGVRDARGPGLPSRPSNRSTHICPPSPERRRQLVSEDSPAAGLPALGGRGGGGPDRDGSSHRSRIGRILVGGTGERLLSGAPAPAAVAPARCASPAEGSRWWAVSSTAGRSRAEPFAGRQASRSRRRPGHAC